MVLLKFNVFRDKLIHIFEELIFIQTIQKKNPAFYEGANSVTGIKRMPKMSKTLNTILKHITSLPARNVQSFIHTCSRRVTLFRPSVTSYLIHLREISVSGDFFSYPHSENALCHGKMRPNYHGPIYDLNVIIYRNVNGAQYGKQ
jgi:hypothetical protein